VKRDENEGKQIQLQHVEPYV